MHFSFCILQWSHLLVVRENGENKTTIQDSAIKCFMKKINLLKLNDKITVVLH